MSYVVLAPAYRNSLRLLLRLQTRPRRVPAVLPCQNDLNLSPLLPPLSCSTPGLNLGSAVLTVHDSQELPPIVRSFHPLATSLDSPALFFLHQYRQVCGCSAHPSSLMSFAVFTTMSHTPRHNSLRDAAPVRREELPTLVSQSLLGQLGLGAADPEASDAQGAEIVDVRATPELFCE